MKAIQSIRSRMMTHKKRVIIATIAIVAYLIFGSKKTDTVVHTEADTVVVTSGSIANTLQVLWTTNLVTSQTLTFWAGGRVQKIYVKQWDTVKKWQVLAEIDRRDADNEIRAQELSIQSAQISYNKLFSSTKEYQITQAQLNAANASGNVSAGKLEIANLEAEKEIKLQEQRDIIAEKQKSLDIINAQGSDSDITKYSAQAVSAENDALDTIQQARDGLRTLKDIFHTDDPNNQALIYIGGKSTSSLNAAIAAISQLEAALNVFVSAHDTYTNTATKDVTVILTLENANKILLNNFSNATQAANNALNQSVTDTRYYSDATLQSNRSSVSSLSNKVISLLNSINNSIKELQNNDTDILTLKNDIAAAQRNLDKVSLDYDLQIIQKKNDIASNQWNVEVSNQNAESLIQWPTDDEKAGIQNQITQAQLNLTKSRKTLEDYQIIAQFEWTVSVVWFKVWDQITQLNEGITIEVPWIYEVNVLLDQLDIVKINLWQEAKIVFDAYPENVFTGVISNIDPTPQTDQWVVSYKATIVLEKAGQNIYNEMSATVDITLEKKDDVLVIPALSITSSGSLQSVQIWNDGKLEVRKIQTGINNGKEVEVISGLTAGEKITTKEFKITTKAGWFSLAPNRWSGQSMQPGGGNAGAR